MVGLRVDLPSLQMVIFLTVNIIVSFSYASQIPTPREYGLFTLIFGFLILGYILLYLRGGFFGETKPVLDHLITRGPYLFCRHPLYLSFIIIVLGMDLLFRSLIGLAFTFAASIPSVAYRVKVEDRLLSERLSEEWRKYAEKVGFLFPKLRWRRHTLYGRESMIE